MPYVKSDKRHKQTGRPKGVSNWQSRAIKDMIREALHQKGGVKWIMQQMDDNPVAVISLIAKLIPSELAIDSTTRGNLTISWESDSNTINTTYKTLNNNNNPVDAMVLIESNE